MFHQVGTTAKEARLLRPTKCRSLVDGYLQPAFSARSKMCTLHRFQQILSDHSNKPINMLFLGLSWCRLLSLISCCSIKIKQDLRNKCQVPFCLELQKNLSCSTILDGWSSSCLLWTKTSKGLSKIIPVPLLFQCWWEGKDSMHFKNQVSHHHPIVKLFVCIDIHKSSCNSR